MSYSHLLDNDGNMRFNVKSGIVASQLSTTLQHNITSATSNKFITHTLDAYGYHVKNGLTNTKLLSVSDSNVLNDCIVKNEITQSVTPLSTTLSAHEVRISAVEAGQPAGQPLGISNILTTNNDASNKSVVGLNNVSCQSIQCSGTVDGSNITTLTNNVESHDTTIAMLNNEVTKLNAFHNRDSATLTTITNNITSLTAYKNNVKRFMNALSQSLNLINPDTGAPFDFTGLI